MSLAARVGATRVGAPITLCERTGALVAVRWGGWYIGYTLCDGVANLLAPSCDLCRLPVI